LNWYIDELEKSFRSVSGQVQPEGEQAVLSFDGKALRGSGSKVTGKKCVRIFNILSNAQQIVLAHRPLESEKTSEIQAFQELLQTLDLDKTILTAAPVQCQKKTLN
jgi:hypothetical protein